MDAETDKVKRLLDLAAAMSSAQAKETGNSKLDMGGIMAVLALAKQEEDEENEKSFLHGSLYNGNKNVSSYTKTTSSSSSTVSSSFVKTTKNETVNDVKTERREENKSFLHQHSQEMKEEKKGKKPNFDDNALNSDKILDQTNINCGAKVGERKGIFKSISDKNGTTKSEAFTDVKIEKREENKSFLHQQSQDMKKERTWEKSNTDGNAINSDQNEKRIDKKFGSKVAGKKGLFENISDKGATSSSNSSSTSNSPVIGKRFGRQVNTSATSQPYSKTNMNAQYNTGPGFLAKVIQDKTHATSNVITTESDMVTDAKTQGREGHRTFLHQHSQGNEENFCEQHNTDVKAANADQGLKLRDKNSGGQVAGRKAIFEATSDNKSETSSSKFSSIGSPSVFAKRFDRQEIAATNQTGSRPNINVPHFTGSAAIAKVINKKKNEVEWKYKNEPSNTSPALKSVNISQTQDNDKFKSICETKNVESSDSVSSNKDQTVRSEIIIDLSQKQNSKGLQRRLTQLLDPKDEQVSKFLAAISNLSSVQEEKTGNGRLDMQGILNAISVASGDIKNCQTVNHTDNCDSRTISNVENKKEVRDSTLSSSLTGEMKKTASFTGAHYTTLETKKATNQTTNSSGKARTTLPNSDEHLNSKNWTEALKGAKVSSGLHRAEVANVSNSSQDIGTNASKKGSTFDNSKQSVVSELKNILNNDTAEIHHMDRETKARGYQLPPMDPIEPEDIEPKNPTVKRIVYNQYREMLNSYSVSSQSK